MYIETRPRWNSSSIFDLVVRVELRDIPKENFIKGSLSCKYMVTDIVYRASLHTIDFDEQHVKTNTVDEDFESDSARSEWLESKGIML